MPVLSFATDPSPKLEQAIRPFLYDPPRPRAERAEPQQDANAAVLEWSCTTNVEVTTIPALAFTVTWPKEQTEVSRTSVTRRVTNPDDPNQFVDVEDASSIDFRNPDGSRSRTNYADQS